MLKKIVDHKVSIASSIIFVVLLALIRAYEDNLFYDPFLDYFKSDYQNLPIPQTNKIQLFFGLFCRYFLNTIISLAIIYILFKDVDAVKFASVLYFIFFVILIGAFFFIVTYNDEVNKMSLFYVRRFLIQPIFLLLFVPAFYFQKQKP